MHSVLSKVLFIAGEYIDLKASDSKSSNNFLSEKVRHERTNGVLQSDVDWNNHCYLF